MTEHVNWLIEITMTAYQCFAYFLIVYFRRQNTAVLLSLLRETSRNLSSFFRFAFASGGVFFREGAHFKATTGDIEAAFQSERDHDR